MYEACFGLQRRPFASVPCVEQYFPGAAIDEARQTLSLCVERAAGVGIVVGPSGTGKTLMCQILARQFEERLKVALLCSGRLSTRRALLQAIQYELGQPYQRMDEGELRLALVDYLESAEDAPEGILLLVDEAHTLPLRLFDEVRMITNIVVGDQPRVRLVLAGGPMLEERLAHPKLESFSQRLVARCYLEPFTRTETVQYIRAQIEAAGGDAERLMSDAACQAAYQASGGVARIVNQVCDHALLLGCANGLDHLEAANVEEAWADLQQLPTPSSSELRRNAAAGGGVVEFGGLDDGPDEPAREPMDRAIEEPVAEPACEEDWRADDELSSEPEAEMPDEPAEEMPDELEVDLSEEAEMDEGPVILPRLHISPETDDFAEEKGPAPELLDQLDRIENALADMDEEFHPAGSIGPEVEIVLDDTTNPLDEQFEEEEVVVERVAPKRAGRPSIFSPTILPAARKMADPHEDEDEDIPATDSAAPRDRESDINRSGVIQQSASQAIPAPVRFDAARDEGRPEKPRISDADLARALPRPETVAMHERSSDEEAGRLEDEDMIVVEEGYEDVGLSSRGQATPVCRQEYRQLFARLRRGG